MNLVVLVCVTVLVLSSTVATNKTCCPGENVYDVQAKRCTEKWAENRVSMNIIGCKTRFKTETELIGEEISDSCYVKFLNGAENDSTVTFYISCLNEQYMASQDRIQIAGLAFMAISVVFLILTAAVYVILPELRDLQGKCIMHILCSLICAYVSLLIVNFPSSLAHVECQLFATTTYISFTYTFWWLLILSFHIWRTTVKPNSYKNSNWSLIYHLTGALGPLCCLIILLIVEHHPSGIFDNFRPNFGLRKCWFDADKQIWMYFYGPLVVVLTINSMFYIWTVGHLWKQMNNTQNRALTYRVRMCIKLCVIMGLTWTIELITFSYKNALDTIIERILFIFIPDIMNALQGVLVFMVLVVFRKRVRRLLAKKTFCNHRLFPIAWTNLHDEEMDSEQIKERQTEYEETETVPMQPT
ncbi:G-protein coupled receptor Mth2-like [Anthonomus grandis grandis]|uniref:G-protein coupled receptor Mth2-like n=1 Tax=Anthonomus grandis grandis TaxID=2921223 RepID=UPI002165F090|nr:G-protein coupled receptor Mth2-like [Anthonomus grandis grandis]